MKGNAEDVNSENSVVDAGPGHMRPLADIWQRNPYAFINLPTDNQSSGITSYLNFAITNNVPVMSKQIIV